MKTVEYKLVIETDAEVTDSEVFDMLRDCLNHYSIPRNQIKLMESFAFDWELKQL